MDADEDVDRRCVDCGGSCRNYDIVGSDDHAYARRMCGRCSLQRQQDDDDDYEEGKDERRMCDNCGVICGYLADGVDHACYTRCVLFVCNGDVVVVASDVCRTSISPMSSNRLVG